MKNKTAKWLVKKSKKQKNKQMKTFMGWFIKTVSGLVYDRFIIILSFFADICLCPYSLVVKQKNRDNRLSLHEFG